VFCEAREGGADAFAATVEAYRRAANIGAAPFPGEAAAAKAVATAEAKAGVAGAGGDRGGSSSSGGAGAPGACGGALLLAVMRGRASEGADFRDAACRAVVVVGVPYPSLTVESRLVMGHRDGLRGRGAGDEW
jgi:hypothetical protein